MSQSCWPKKRSYILVLQLLILCYRQNSGVVVVMGQTTTTTTTATATTTNNSTTTIDEDLVTRWDDSIDFEGCFSDLLRADRNGDGQVKQGEYLNFIQEYGKRLCFKTDSLTLQQSGVFNSLSCICRSQENADSQCCMGNKAHLSTSGADLASKSRSPIQTDYLTSICKLTDATIDARCPPILEDRDEPFVPVLPGNGVLASSPVSPAAAAAPGNDGLEWWMWLLIAIAALILFCCCFCCLWQRRRAKQEEMEQEDEHIVASMDEKGAGAGPRDADPEQPLDRTEPYNGSDPDLNADKPIEEETIIFDDVVLPEVVPIPSPGTIPMAGASGAVVGEDSEDEEEERRKKGGDRIPQEPDEEIIKYRGAPPFPPVDPPPVPPHPLKPIPDKEKETDEWDQPGRDIQYPVEQDEMSAGHVDHYEPDGGVYFPERPMKDPLSWNRDWNRAKPEEPDEMDARKHRIQTGLGEGEVWNKLEEQSTHVPKNTATGGDGFDWVIQSALGALGDNSSSSHHNPTILPTTATSTTLLDKIVDTDDEGEFAEESQSVQY
jgi:hypothetical protein